MTLQTLIAVASGGALGALARYGAHRTLTLWHGTDAAWSTLGVNAVGSFGLGLAVASLAGRTGIAATFLTVGLFGAFTTFSTFALDAVTMFRDRGPATAALYIGLSVAISIIALLGGLAAGKGLS